MIILKKTYFQSYRFIGLLMNSTNDVAKASLSQKVTVFVDILELNCVAVTSNNF